MNKEEVDDQKLHGKENFYTKRKQQASNTKKMETAVQDRAPDEEEWR